MWEAIKKAKSIPLDLFDQILNDMIRRTLRDEIIPFDEWQDLVDDIEREAENAPDVDAILQKYGIRPEELAEQSERARKAFLDMLRRYGLPLDDRLELCRLLYQKAAAAPSDELLRLYCDIVCDGGFLLDIERAGDDGAICWLFGKEDSDTLYHYLSECTQKKLRFRRVLEDAKKVRFSASNAIAEPSSRAHKIFQEYNAIFKPGENGENQENFLVNIIQLLQIADHTDELAPIKPLFLYRMLTRHGKRMRTSETLKIDFRALWNYQTYQFEQNNGKNYQTNASYLKLFSKLCGIFQSDKAVDIPLCICGFEQLSNLSDFYRFYCFLEPLDFEILFTPSVDELLDESLFSCFERGAEDNVLLSGSGLPLTALDRFQRSSNRSRALEAILDYMNKHLADLIEQFWGAPPDAVERLCADILEASALPSSQQPKTTQDTALFLAAINRGLMDAVDDVAMQYLTATGEMLLCE